jgi:hypothetical protein
MPARSGGETPPEGGLQVDAGEDGPGDLQERLAVDDVLGSRTGSRRDSSSGTQFAYTPDVFRALDETALR